MPNSSGFTNNRNVGRNDNKERFTILTQLLQDLAAIATIIGLPMLISQIYLQRREHRREGATLLYNDINTTEFRRALRFVYTHNPEKLIISNLSEEGLEKVELVTANFDRLGFRIKTGQIHEDDAYHLFRDPVLKAAQQLQIHQEDQRKRRKGEKKYNPDFDWLARRFKIRQLKEKGIEMDKSIRKLNLQELLKKEEIPINEFKQDDRRNQSSSGTSPNRK